MTINIYPSKNTLTNSSGDIIGEAGKDTLQTEDRRAAPVLESVVQELKLVNEHLAEMLGDNLRKD